MLIVWLIPAAAAVSSAAGAERPRLLSDDAEVRVLTIRPGSEVHARFGHTAIRVRDPRRGFDWAELGRIIGDEPIYAATRAGRGFDWIYNYGTFHFDSPWFVLTFARGRLDYYLSIAPTDAALHQYRRIEGRAVTEQVLDLTPAERDAMLRFLEHNALQANREYRYRFLDDNCSTRVRDAIELVLNTRGAAIDVAGADEPGMTYRQMLRPYLANAPLLELGIDLALGRPADEPVDAWSAMFLPLPLDEVFDAATVRRQGLEARPLVAERRTLHWYAGADERERAWPWLTMALWALLAGAVVVTLHEARRGVRIAGGRAGDALLLAGVGLTGATLAGLWGLTEHDVTGPNLHLVWAWPTHLLAAAVVPNRAAMPWVRVYLAAAAAVAAAAAAAWPWWPQGAPSGVLPVLLMLALRAGWLAWRPPMGPEAPARGDAPPPQPAQPSHAAA